MSLQLDDYRLLGRSGLRISPLSLGAMTFGTGVNFGSNDEETKRIFDRYVEAGGNALDTANFYGQSEVVCAELIKPLRERIVLSTKYSLSVRRGDPNAGGNNRKNMVRSVEDSLKRLGTDYIDLLYLHVWDDRTPVDEILRAFDDLVASGKVLYIGISDSPAWQISRMQAIAELRGWTTFCALQIPYSLAERTTERELMPMAKGMGIGVMPWSPLAGGVLSGKYSRADLAPPTGEASARQQANLSTGKLNARTLDIADVVVAVAKEIERTPSQVALAWTLLHPAVVSPVIGARTLAQLEDNLGALDVTLGAEQLARLNEASKITPGFPHNFLNSPATPHMFGGVKVERRAP